MSEPTFSEIATAEKLLRQISGGAEMITFEDLTEHADEIKLVKPRKGGGEERLVLEFVLRTKAQATATPALDQALAEVAASDRIMADANGHAPAQPLAAGPSSNVDETGLTTPCDGGCGSPEPHNAHLAPGALEKLHQGTATQQPTPVMTAEQQAAVFGAPKPLAPVPAQTAAEAVAALNMGS